ncbi:MAG TPA: MFS transporter, partial [Clostridia bacterium]|nr:MFS transporter [Clostridia bacterium]
LYMIATSLIHPVTPAIIRNRAFNSYMFGVALAVMHAALFLFSPLWGRLCSYLSSRRVTAIGLLGYALGQLIFCFAQTEGMVIVGRAIAGMFCGGTVTGLLTYIVNISEPERRSRNLIIYTTLQSIFNAAGYFIGGLMGTASIDAAFYVQIGLLTLLAAGFRLFCSDDATLPLSSLCKARLSQTANPFYHFAASKKFLTPALGYLFAAVALSGISLTALDQCFNYYLMDHFGLSSAYNGIFKAIVALVSLLVNLTVSMAVMRRENRLPQIYVATLLGSAVSAGAMALFMDMPSFVGSYVIFFGFNAIRMPLQQSLAADNAPKAHSNVAMGIYNSMNSFGSILGALFAGLIYAWNAKLPFWVSFAAMLVALVVLFIYKKLYPAAHEEQMV